jgi:hypothetical protein
MLVLDLHQLGGVLGQAAAGGDDGGHPLPGVAGLPDGQGVPDYIGQVHILRDALHPLGQLSAHDDLHHAEGPLRRAGVDALDNRMGVGRRHRGQVEHAREHDVVDVAAFAQGETPVLNGREVAAYP